MKKGLLILLLSFMLVGCSKQEILENLNLAEDEKETTETEPETEPVVLAPEFLENAVDNYIEEIGESEVGNRIVERKDAYDTIEFSVYKFDDVGFTHSYYLFAYEESKFLSNQTGRLMDIQYEEDSLIVDEGSGLVKFDLPYVYMGDNAYNYFRDVLIGDMNKRLLELDGSIPDELPDKIVYDDYTYTIVGDMSEFIPELPELEQDEEGYTLCDVSDKFWTYISDGNGGLILTGYSNEQYGNKLVIPNVVNGKPVYAVRQLEPIQGVTCVEVSEGISELQGSFNGWSELNRLILHEGLLSITQNALNSTNIENLELPHSILNLEDGFFARSHVGAVSKFDYDITKFTGFYQNSDISSIIIPGTVTYIDSEVFKNCEQLTTVFIEDGCTNISEKAFLGAPNLQAVAIPSTVEHIGADAFSKNTLLVLKEGSYAVTYAELYGLTYVIQ